MKQSRPREIDSKLSGYGAKHGSSIGQSKLNSQSKPHRLKAQGGFNKSRKHRDCQQSGLTGMEPRLGVCPGNYSVMELERFASCDWSWWCCDSRNPMSRIFDWLAVADRAHRLNQRESSSISVGNSVVVTNPVDVNGTRLGVSRRLPSWK